MGGKYQNMSNFRPQNPKIALFLLFCGEYKRLYDKAGLKNRLCQQPEKSFKKLFLRVQQLYYSYL